MRTVRKTVVTGGTSYVIDDEDSEGSAAAIYSNDDLTINGSGSLTVTGNCNNAIQSKDDLIITGGTINITAANDGLKGKDSIAIKDGTITINANGDGFESTNDTDEGKGYIVIDGGTIDITAGLDGIQAQTNLSVTGEASRCLQAAEAVTAVAETIGQLEF